jgi:C4-dicarboxylate transporter DctM subunit
LKLKDVPRTLLASANMSAMLLYIITNAVPFSFLLTHENIPQAISERLPATGLGTIGSLLAGNLFPIAMKPGIDPVHFGVISP